MDEAINKNQPTPSPESPRDSGRRTFSKNQRPRGNSPRDRVSDEFQEKTLDVRRVTRVVAGGKRFRFRVTMVVGDGRGRVGVGIAKGVDVASAIDKSKKVARRNIITVPLKGKSIPHEVEAKYSAARIRLRPAVEGHGMRAGGAARVVLSLAGVADVIAKTLGRTPNKLTNALATVEALKKLKPSRNR